VTEAEAMQDEFDVYATWTADAVTELGPDHAIPAGCRGSGSPAALEWLAVRLGLAPGVLLLDSGAGIGGPAEFAAQRYGVQPVLVEPMLGACRAARRLFGSAVVNAVGEALPLGDRTVDVAWSLGVLCTAPDQPGLLHELRRVARPGSMVGLLVFVQVAATLPEQPDGNDFPSPDRLADLMRAARLVVTEQTWLDDLASAPADWRQAVEDVDQVIERDHGQDHRFVVAQEQQRSIGRLLSQGLVRGQLLVARAD
jgi:SAM-dependent methyltransferase